jgi:uncharacterized protein (DUF3084 family)
VTEPQLQVKAGFWGELFTAPRIVSFLVLMSGGVAWVQSFRNDVQQLRREVETFKAEYQRSDTLRLELQAIRDEQRNIREEQTRSRMQQEKLSEQMTGVQRLLR